MGPRGNVSAPFETVLRFLRRRRWSSSRPLSRADQASVEQAQPAIAVQPDSKASLWLQAFQELIANGELGANVPGGQVYVEGDKAAVVVPVSINLARDRLKIREIKLPSNNDLYGILRNARLVDADEAGRSVRRIKVQGRQGNIISLSALIFPADKVVPKLLLPTLLRSHFEITTEPAPETADAAEGKAHGEEHEHARSDSATPILSGHKFFSQFPHAVHKLTARGRHRHGHRLEGNPSLPRSSVLAGRQTEFLVVTIPVVHLVGPPWIWDALDIEVEI